MHENNSARNFWKSNHIMKNLYEKRILKYDECFKNELVLGSRKLVRAKIFKLQGARN